MPDTSRLASTLAGVLGGSGSERAPRRAGGLVEVEAPAAAVPRPFAARSAVEAPTGEPCAGRADAERPSWALEPQPAAASATHAAAPASLARADAHRLSIDPMLRRLRSGPAQLGYRRVRLQPIAAWTVHGEQTTPTTAAANGCAAAAARSRRRGTWAALSALLVAAGLVASVLVSRSIAGNDAERSQLAFHLASHEIASTLQLAIQHEEDLVTAASAFFGYNPHATPRQFDAWTGSVHALARYPELQDIGLVAMVPRAGLAAFRAELARRPVEALGPGTAKGGFQIIPDGVRPFYCFAVAGIARSRAAYLPSGLDYCAFAPQLVSARDTAAAAYAPFAADGATLLGVQTPVYRGSTPSTVAGRRRAFVGWLGELLRPDVVVDRALQGHADTAVRFDYRAGPVHVDFASGPAIEHADAQTATIDLHNGWRVQSSWPQAASGILSDRNARLLLAAGTLLSVLAGLLLAALGTGRMRALSLVREKTRELSHQALHDALTGLPNRALVLDRAQQMLARAARNPGELVGALYIDLDGFKHVNDKLGHAAGDRLLKVVGERLLSGVRPQDTVGRLGGDEFVVLLESPADGAPPELLADRLIEAIRSPVELADGRTLFSVSASVGVAVGQYRSPDALLRDADLALYAAKAAGKDRFVLFDPAMAEDVEGAVELETDLGTALRDGQLHLLYQPIFDLSTQQVSGVEALLRWHHPTRGIVAPNEFIPIAEENGLIVPIGRWVLEEACRQAAEWEREGHALAISVNVSAHQLARASFVADVCRALDASGIPASRLTLEITETTLVRDLAGAAQRLREVKQLGVRIAIDDFGTGFASISHLQRMPVDVLKVDRSFVAALEDGGSSRELLGAILGVGAALSLAVVAEGIELQSQMTALREMGCELAQGFLMARPSAPEAVVGMLAEPGWRTADPAAL